MAEERDVPTRLGRFGRPVRSGLGVAGLLVTGAAVVVFALRGELSPEVKPPQGEAGTDTITPGAAITQPVLPIVQSTAMPVPQPRQSSLTYLRK